MDHNGFTVMQKLARCWSINGYQWSTLFHIPVAFGVRVWGAKQLYFV